MSKQSNIDEILHQLLDSQFNPLKRQETINVAKQAILDWHNKQIEELLDRLESKRQSIAVHNFTDGFSPAGVINAVPISAIEAERNKLKEGSNEPTR